eukprot:1161744-Pelagomonas_calceolata.AAC.19
MAILAVVASYPLVHPNNTMLSSMQRNLVFGSCSYICLHFAHMHVQALLGGRAHIVLLEAPFEVI